MKSTEGAAPAAIAPTIALDIQEIEVTHNVRRNFDKDRLEELAENIKAVGVLQPILVRANGEKYQLIAGERRLRAAKLAGLQQIPARILEADDKTAAEIQAFENLHREDLGPIEEAQAFKTLLDQGGYDVKSLADRVDKSEAYVYRSIALLDLPEGVVSRIEDGTLTPAHGHQILRLPKDKWKDAMAYALSSHYSGDVQERPSAKALREHVDAQLGTDLKRAAFPKDKDYAGEVACQRCTFNSGNQGMLFDGAKGGRCMKRTCFDKKTEQAYQDLAAEGQKVFPGLKYGGTVAQHYNIARKAEDRAGIALLSDADAKQKKIQALAKEKPGKFEIVVVIGSSYSWSQTNKLAPRWALACLDPSLVGGIMPRSHPSRRGSSSSGGGEKRMSKEDQAREEWMHNRAAELLTEDVLAKVQKVDARHLRRIVLGVGDMTYGTHGAEEAIDKHFRLYGKGLVCHPDHLKHLSAHELGVLSWVKAIDWDDESPFEEAGLNIAKLRREAETQAGDEWDKAHPKKEAPNGKTGQKKTGKKAAA